MGSEVLATLCKQSEPYLRGRVRNHIPRHKTLCTLYTCGSLTCRLLTHLDCWAWAGLRGVHSGSCLVTFRQVATRQT